MVKVEQGAGFEPTHVRIQEALKGTGVTGRLQDLTMTRARQTRKNIRMSDIAALREG